MIKNKWKVGDIFLYPDGDKGKVIRKPDAYEMVVYCINQRFAHMLKDDRFIKKIERKDNVIHSY